jgi:hypothetical protein
MKFIQLMSVIAFVVFISACNPDSYNYDDPVDNGFKLLGTKTVGSEGASISFNELTIDIPVGAFSTSVSIEVYQSTAPNNNHFSGNSLSEPFLIKGLPDEINAYPILRFPIEGSYDGDPLVAFGFEQYVSSLDSMIFTYRTHDAVIENGELVCALAPVNRGLKNTTGMAIGFPSNMKFIPIFDFKKTKSSNFNVAAPKNTPSKDIERIEAYLDGALRKYSSLGFNTGGRTTPMEVTVMELKDEPETCGMYSAELGIKSTTDATIRDCWNQGCMVINEKYLTDLNELRFTIAHELMHFVQNLYEFSDPDVEPEQFWLSEATAVWAEGQFSSDEYYESNSIYGNEHSPSLGWQSTQEEEDRGYGMAFLFNEIEDTYGVHKIVSIFDKIKDGTVPTNPTDPIDAVASVLEYGMGFFWHRTFCNYVMGAYYGGSFLNNLLSNEKLYTGDIEINRIEAEYSVSEKFDYVNLSGKLTEVDFTAQDFDDDFQLIISTDKPSTTGIMALAWDFDPNTQPEYISICFPGEYSLAIPEVNKIITSGKRIILAVTNSNYAGDYRQTDEIEITVSQIELVDDPFSGEYSGTMSYILPYPETGWGCQDFSATISARNVTDGQPTKWVMNWSAIMTRGQEIWDTSRQWQFGEDGNLLLIDGESASSGNIVLLQWGWDNDASIQGFVSESTGSWQWNCEKIE